MALPVRDGDTAAHALRFVLAEPRVSTALVGTTSAANLRAAVDAAAAGPLESAAVLGCARAAFRRCDHGWDGGI